MRSSAAAKLTLVIAPTFTSCSLAGLFRSIVDLAAINVSPVSNSLVENAGAFALSIAFERHLLQAMINEILESLRCYHE